MLTNVPSAYEDPKILSLRTHIETTCRLRLGTLTGPRSVNFWVREARVGIASSVGFSVGGRGRWRGSGRGREDCRSEGSGRLLTLSLSMRLIHRFLSAVITLVTFIDNAVDCEWLDVS